MNLLALFPAVYLELPAVDVLQAGLLVVDLVLPEELLHHEGDPLDPHHGVARLVEPHQVPGLPAHRQEDADLRVTGGQLVHILEYTNNLNRRIYQN